MRLAARCFDRLNMTDWVGHPHPKRKLIRSVLINEMCLFEVSVRKANAEISAELASHTSPFCNDYNKLQSFAFRSLCSFSHTPKTALSSFLLTHKFACF